MSIVRNTLVAAIATVSLSSIATAATLYSDSFNTDTSANYTVSVTKSATTTTPPSTPTSDATFAYDYSALGIPAAPHTTDGTTIGLRLRTDNLGNTGDGSLTGGVTVTSTALASLATLPTTYTISADVWGNFIGGASIASSGSNGTTFAAIGAGATNTNVQTPGTTTGAFFGATHDAGGTSLEYRAYVQAGRLDSVTNPGVYAAGNTATAENHADPYYAFLTSHTAPAAQLTLSSTTQGGSTPVGTIGFAWHTFYVTQDGTNFKWYIDGHLIATVADTALTATGSNFELGAFDTSTGGNSTAINQLLNADFYDNLTVVDGLAVPAIPEPTTLAALAGVGGVMLRRRRAR